MGAAIYSLAYLQGLTSVLAVGVCAAHDERAASDALSLCFCCIIVCCFLPSCCHCRPTVQWTHEGYPLVELGDRSKETRRVHVFGADWALQGRGYEPVMFKRPVLRWALICGWGKISLI